ncbi:MAG: GlxA family transcriptional regulator [Gammaproteobacteria bacterium]
MNKYAISKLQVEKSGPRLIGIFVYPGVEIIDIVGPTEVFAFANIGLQKEGLATAPVYNCELLAKDELPVTTLSGVQIVPTCSFQKNIFCTFDTLMVPGCAYPEEAIKDKGLIKNIAAYSKNIRRLASICTGAFLLAKTGLIDGHRVTTHWGYSNSFENLFPLVRLERDQIFVRDRSIWSSGGVTSGIDLALAMIEEDWGRKLALEIARLMVVFLKRAGNQSQLSPYLEMDASNRSDIRDLQAWIMENPCSDLRIEALAKKMEMSLRHFARTFLSETGVTPAKYIEKVRIDLVRNYLENTDDKLSDIVQKTGFKDTETMRRTFYRHVGINPSDYRDRFCNDW